MPTLSTPLELLSRLASDRGAIVSSADCSEMEIVFARRDGRFYVDPETSYGYVLRFKEWRERAEGCIAQAFMYAEMRSNASPSSAESWAREAVTGDSQNDASSFPALEAETAAILSLRAAQAGGGVWDGERWRKRNRRGIGSWLRG